MDLTLRQKQLLELLSINCRFSNKDIAKSLHCSEDAVDYQIKNLIEKEKLARFSIQFDYYLLGYRQYHLWIRTRDMNINHSQLNELSSIISVNESYGKYDLQLIALVKSSEELAETIAAVKEIVHITDIAVAEFHSYLRPFTNIIPPLNVPVILPRNKKNVLYKLNQRDFLFSKDRSLVHLDSVDKKIIKVLLKDPRIKFSELSEKTGINHETLRYRISGYVKRGFIMNFGLLHNFQKYSLYTTYLLVNASGFDKNFIEYLEKEDNVFYAACIMGAYAGIIYLVSHNPEELGQKLKGIRKALGDKLLSFDLIHMGKIYKYIQFPEKELQ